jgi:predicted nicotinamide N-methyase
MSRWELLSRGELARRRARLLERIHRRFETISEEIPVGPLRLHFARVADPNKVLDQVAAEEDRREKLSGQRRDGNELHLPYWAELWDSAIGMAQFLVSARSSILNLRSSSVLDLGCGMGFTGMVAAALGARRIVLADLERDALLFARLNTLPYSRRVSTRQLNWQTDRVDARFELILGADVLYDRKQWDFLEPFWRNHLADGGAVLLGEPGRKSGDLFVDWVAERGWRLDRFDEPVVNRSTPIRLFHLSRA